jgi:hypothetical protein
MHLNIIIKLIVVLYLNAYKTKMAFTFIFNYI